MSEHSMDERSEELWGRVVAGELEPSSLEVREQAERDPVFREALRDADRLRGALARAGEDQSALMREALGEVTDADREAVRELLRARAAGPGPASSWRGLGWLVAVAAAVLALVWVAPWRERTGGTTGPLEDPAHGRAFPVGAVAAVDHFRLPEDLQLGATARISVYDAEAPADATAMLVSPELTSDRWDLTEAEIAALPRRMRWRVDQWDGTGERLPPRTFECERAE